MGRILVIDDDTAVRGTIREILALDNHEVAEAADGGEALAEIARSSFDVITLDLIMPGRSSWDLLPHLRLAAPRILIVSAVADDPRLSLDHLRLHGVTGIWGKPLDTTSFRAHINSLLLRRAG